MTGAHGVFGVTQPWSADYRTVDIRVEIRQGKNIIDAAIEAYTRAAKAPRTVVRPASFMDNNVDSASDTRPLRLG